MHVKHSLDCSVNPRQYYQINASARRCARGYIGLNSGNSECTNTSTQSVYLIRSDPLAETLQFHFDDMAGDGGKVDPGNRRGEI